MSDVIEGAVFEETAARIETDVFAREAAPEIVVEGSSELRLRDFFAPRLWAAALIPLVFTAFTSNLTVVRVSDAVSLFGRGAAYEDLYFQAPNIPILARHLLPFGLPLTTETGYGYGLTNILQTNFWIGVLALLIGALLVSAVTRRTNDAIYLAGPYFVYTAICVALLWKKGAYFQTATDIFPALLGGLLAPLLVGLIAKIVGAAMRNQGWLEADMDLAAIGASAGEPEVAFAVGTISSTTAAPTATGPADAQLVLRHVSAAKACPFCGNPKINQHKLSCSRCHRNIGLAIEHEEHPCPHCGEALVNGAEFCHHCTMWLKAEPVGAELEVA